MDLLGSLMGADKATRYGASIYGHSVLHGAMRCLASAKRAVKV